MMSQAPSSRRWIATPLALLATTGFSAAAVDTVYQVGAESFWTSGEGFGITWHALGTGDVSGDYTASSSNFDLVGDSSDAGFSYAKSANYLFFRMRVDNGTFPTTATTSPSGAYFVLIDVANYGISGVDYAFSWDSFNGGSRNGVSFDANHGLEMSILNTGGTLTSEWGNTKLKDLDGIRTEKLANDINGLHSTNPGEGYVRTTDEQSTTNFGSTTLIDFAVKWSYLDADTNLRNSQTWNVTAANLYEIQTADDHMAITGDVYGAGSGAKLLSAATWSPINWSAVPEPGSALAGLLLAAGLLRRRRH